MVRLYVLVILIINCARRASSQASSVYTCVPAAFCPNGTPNNPTINPRIVSPGDGGGSEGYLCPAGQVTCYTQGRNSNCGVVSVTPVNTNPGTSTPGAYPWQAYITINNAFVGSGILLNNYHVLTAAHKVAANRATPQNIRVFMGVYNPANLAGTRNSTVQKVIVARDFNATTLTNDLAILKLFSPMPLGVQNTINTGCLPDATQSFIGQNCRVAGWGQSSFSSNDAPTNPMKQVTVPIVDHNTCRASFSNTTLLGGNVDVYLDRNEICAGGQQLRDACTQDGGAPLMCLVGQRYYVAGLVIWGKNCGLANVYGVYVSIPAYKARIDAAISTLNTNINSINNF